MKIKTFVLPVVLGIFFSIETSFASSLTLKDCLQRAQQNSYRLKADEQRIESAQQNFYFDKSRTRPQISGELAGEQRLFDQYSFNQVVALVHADWSLGDFLLKTARAAQQDVLMAKAEKEQIRLQTSRRAALLYMSSLQKQTQADLLKNRLDLLQAHHNVAQALWQAGTRTQLDVLQTESEMSQIQEQMARLDIERQNLLQELGRLMDVQKTESLQLGAIETATICTQPAPTLAAGMLRSNPIMMALNYQIKAQQIRTRAVRAQQLPHVHVAGGYFADSDPTGDGNYYQMNAGIDLPLFRWGQTKFQRQESRALTQSLQLQQKDVERELIIHIEQTIKTLDKLKNVLDLQNNRLNTTQKAFQFAEANYQAGLITNLDYLSAQQQLTETQMAIQKTQLEYVMNLIEFYVTTNQVEKIEEL